MAARTKITPFARFLLFLIILLPAAYFGASYYRGEDPMAKLQSTFSNDQTPAASKSGKTLNLQDRLQELEKENAALKSELKALKAKLQESGDNATSSREKWGN